MTTNTIIHKIDTFHKTCIVTLVDGGKTLLNGVNIGLELNSDGTANTQFIKDKLRQYVFAHRLHKLNDALYPEIE